MDLIQNIMRKTLFFVAVVFLSTFNLIAQQATIYGVISDGSGEPLPGAAVQASNGEYSIADADGKYTIGEASFPITLTVSYLGFLDKAVNLTGNEAMPFNIILTASDNVLDETVVVGYGTQKKNSLSGAVSVINGDMLNARPVVSASNALQGADPSVNITYGSGGPTESAKINIRGSISINGGSPLVLVDGVEVDINTVNPNDIESVSVLKDASSAAIYGAKASAGVILITTKQGKSGEARITYNGRYAVVSNTTSSDFIVSGYEHALISNMFSNNSTSTTKQWTSFADGSYDLEQLYLRKDDVKENPERPWSLIDPTTGIWKFYGNFDWYGFLFRRHRPQQDHNLSISGGSDKVKYYVSGRYFDQDGWGNGKLADDYKDYSFRSKITAEVKPWITYSNNISLERNTYDYAKDLASALQNVYYMTGPQFLPYYADGVITNKVSQITKGSQDTMMNGWIQPVLADAVHNDKTTSNMNMTNRIDIKLFDGLTLTGSYDFRYYGNEASTRENRYTYRISEEIKTSTNDESYKYVSQIRNSHVINAYATFDRTFGLNHVAGVAGMQYENYRSYKVTSATTEELDPNYSSFSLSATEGIKTISDEYSTYATRGYFTRLNYDYSGKYLLELSGRFDGSSRFPANSRWGFFPGGSAAWRISEEDFFSPMKGWWNNAKLRFSAGSLGNQQVSNYSYVRELSTSSLLNFTFDGTSKVKKAIAASPVSSSLTWETVTTYDLGFDLGFMNNRLTVEGDLYMRDTDGMLTQLEELPAVYGADEPKTNAADLRTKGYEIKATYRNAFVLDGKECSFSLTSTFGDNLTKITKYDNTSGLISEYYEGKTLGEIWGYRIDGLFESDADAALYQSSVDTKYVNYGIFTSAPLGENKLRAGDLRVKDINGDGAINDGKKTLSDHGDLERIGNTTPRYSYSLRGDLSWNGFDLAVFFQGIGKKDWFFSSDYRSLGFWQAYGWNTCGLITKDFLDNCWTPENPDAYFPRIRGFASRNGQSDELGSVMGCTNDRYLQNIGYLRLKNATLGYTIPQKYSKAIKIDRARIYLTGENLMYWSALKKYCKTIDPEMASGTSTAKDNTGLGYAYPRTVSMGIDITF